MTCAWRHAGLDVRRVSHLRLVVITATPGADDYGNPIDRVNVGSGGFDLDAVGVLNPRIEISTLPGVPAPALPGFQPFLEYKAGIGDADWTTNAPPQGTPGFFRWRLIKE